jgi:NifU-like protein involved in Fe-S cluster formation
MATTFTNLNTALIDDKIVEALKHVLPLLDMFSHVILAEDAIKAAGQDYKEKHPGN